jgi:transcriptional regulator with PAS, ATPase and Fis domain
LFGYRRGAFTGAERGHDGHLQAASGGTLFLDEIAELSLDLQAKLLRVLDQGRLMRVGETSEVEIDARIVIAVQRPLAELCAQRILRQDLAARLNGLNVRLPPLLERRGDIPSLFRYFLTKYSGGHPPEVSCRVYERLCQYDWPDNVRELELLARQLLDVHGLEHRLQVSHLPPSLVAREKRAAEPRDPTESRDQHDLRHLKASLSKTEGNLLRAAELAGISRQRAYRLLGSQADPPSK